MSLIEEPDEKPIWKREKCIALYERMINGTQQEVQHDLAVVGDEDEKKEKKWSSLYSADVLNTSISAEEIVEMVKNAVEFGKTEDSFEKGIKLLFYGCSGTGKSRFAEYIAKELGRKIDKKNASDILSKWVGDSERNLAEAFRSAKKSNSILLFDEVDSFLSDRNGLTNSWERQQTNELLTQIENFSGILICTTNLKDILDKAMLRRFHILVEFKPLTKDGVCVMLKNYFPSLHFDENQIDKIASFETAAPGDFSILHSRIRFMKKDSATSDYITDELCKMQDEKISGNRKIGF